MISGMVRIQRGFAHGQALEPDEMHHSVLPVSNKITNLFIMLQESNHEEAVNKEKGKNYQSCMNGDC